MKNYTLNREDERTFITNYEILEDTINVYYADGHNDHKPKTKEQLEIINYKLEKQAQKGHSHIHKLYALIASHLKSVVGISSIMMLLTPILLNQQLVGATIIIDILGSLIVARDLIKAKKYKNIINDIRKNESFLDKGDEINESIKANPMVLTNTTKKTQETIEECMSTKPELNQENYITLNDLDNISPEDMDIILANIQDLNNTGSISFESDDKPYTIRPKK